MDSETTANGSGNAANGMSAAEKLMKKHAAEEAESHKATVEVRKSDRTYSSQLVIHWKLLYFGALA